MSPPDSKRTAPENSLASQDVDLSKRYRAFVLATSDLVYRVKADWSVILGAEGKNFVAQDQPADPHWFNKNVHPADRERVWAAIQEAISAMVVSRKALPRILPLDMSVCPVLACDTRIAMLTPLLRNVRTLDQPLASWRRHRLRYISSLESSRFSRADRRSDAFAYSTPLRPRLVRSA